ncbi:hypothetical protein FQA39_LY13069 [Lamprigera yunnana]|nr:hypothetical protein FQA39_LY13069 [Lamprigera yunnana]
MLVRIQLMKCCYESDRAGPCSTRNYESLVRKFEETGSVVVGIDLINKKEFNLSVLNYTTTVAHVRTGRVLLTRCCRAHAYSLRKNICPTVVDKKKSGRPPVIDNATVAEVLYANNEISRTNYYGINSVSQVSR